MTTNEPPAEDDYPTALAYATATAVYWRKRAERAEAHGHGTLNDALKCDQCVPTEKLVAELRARGHAR